MRTVSVVVITKNEEKNLPRCLRSVDWADEIIVIDSQSEDKTIEVALAHKAKVYSPEWRGYGPAKKAGVDKATHDWIFSIDADEEVSAGLRSEIQLILQSESVKNGYYVPRKTNFIGKWINHSGWYPDYVLRLFNKQHGNFNEAVIHEKVVISGTTGRLKHDLLHYSYPTLESYFDRFNRYTTVGAEELFRKKKKSSVLKIVFKPAGQFIKQFIIKRGFLDGVDGFLISFLSAVAVMVKYAKLYALEMKDRIHE